MAIAYEVRVEGSRAPWPTFLLYRYALARARAEVRATRRPAAIWRASLEEDGRTCVGAPPASLVEVLEPWGVDGASPRR